MKARAGAWAAVLMVCLASGRLEAQGEAYFFAAAGVRGGGPSGFEDRWCGQDMLPFTDDDIDAAELGNVGGYLAFSWIDLDGDETLDLDTDGDGELDMGDGGAPEHIFNLIDRGDDAAHTFSTRSYPQYGVLAESEDWSDLHDSLNQGYAGVPGDDLAEWVERAGAEFEHNDRPAGGFRGWEDASNYYWYNNYEANQWGWGGSRYYFEHANGRNLDEIEGFVKFLTFQHNYDDPTTPQDERGPCRREYMRSRDAEIRGLLIPVENIPTLEDGELDPLFGWYPGDMATYVRDILWPHLTDNPDLWVWEESSGCARSGFPEEATHLMILQIECPITLNPSGDCGSIEDAKATAARWGIVPRDPDCGLGGETSCETDAVYRVSYILLYNDNLVEADGLVPPLKTEPEDGVKRLLYLHDPFWRADKNDIGRYELEGLWTIVDDANFDFGCGETDHVFQICGEPGAFTAPLAKGLDVAQADVVTLVESGTGDLGIAELGACGLGGEGAIQQLILLDDAGGVIAYAEWSGEESSVHIGGTVGPDGLATGGEAHASGDGAFLAEAALGEFARMVFFAGPDGLRLAQAEPLEFTPNDFEDLDGLPVLVSLEAAPAGTVTRVRFATSGEEDISVVADTFAVFQNLPAPPEPEGLLRRGDSNDDGIVDISDAVYTLNWLFTGGTPPVCLEAANANDDVLGVDISDAVYTLNYLFTGGPAPPAPGPDACGEDPGGATCPESACNA